jgi:hypothetical protein
MGREEVWKTLDDLITQFRKRDETIPPDVMADLRAAKTLIQVLKADPRCVENVPDIDIYLENVESYLIMEAHKKFGAEFADKWMTKLKEASKITVEENVMEPVSRFVPGLPRGQRWVRVQSTKETPAIEVKRLAEESGLTYKEQKDGYVLVYGESEKIKLFVKKAAEKFGGAKAQ